MPAHRLRNERWRESLEQICDRGGCLEISIGHEPAPSSPESSDVDATPDLVWRVRLLGIKDKELLVERPSACGRSVQIVDGVPLVGAIVIGQNRWMFNTQTCTASDGVSPWPAHAGPCLRIRMPEKVERCSRRDFMRVSIAHVQVPKVECWPLLDPASIPAAEVANRALITELEQAPRRLQLSSEGEHLVLPEVGPKFGARLLNMGGGGLGLLIDRTENSAVDHAKLVWMRLDLRPTIPAPLGLVGKIVHTHMDSTQAVYAGVAFEFAFHPAHREFIVEQVEKYTNRLQMKRRIAA
jgi:hypothetical protein